MTDEGKNEISERNSGIVGTAVPEFYIFDERVQQDVWMVEQRAVCGHAAFYESNFGEFDDWRRAGD